MDDVGWSLILLCIFTPILLFFTLNGLALRSFSRLKLQDAFRHAGREKLINDFLEHTESLTLTCGFFRIILNTAILFILIHLFEDRHFILTFIIAICMLELCGLLIPHAWAKHAGEFILPRTYRFLKVLLFIIRPLLAVSDLHDRLVKRLAGVQEADPEQAQEERQEEILSYVEQGRIEGIVDEEEVEMIENVLELGETTAEEIMTPRTDLVAIDACNGLEKILDTIRDKGHSRIPVYEENIDRITGLIYAKDLLTEIGKDPKTFNLKEKMREAYFVPESKLLRDLLHEFQSQKLHIAIVLDEYGGTAGIVTIEDILEELVGEITDEYEKTPAQSYKKIDDLTFDVDARMYIDDVNEEMDIKLPEEEDYDTIGGFVFSHLGYIPKVGETFEHGNVKISVTAAGPRVIKKLRIKKKPNQPQQ
ncbi:MAG: HlyC/CorC family transporter [Phycisphaerae bacterium]|nr:HlyC/CorC family transporter [Phycisphaerae bacterium]